MLSLVGTLRAAARRQSCKYPALVSARASSSTAQADPEEPQELQDMNDLSGQLVELAEKERLKAQTAAPAEDGIVDVDVLPTPEVAFQKGYPILKGFFVGQFTKPKSFTRAEYMKGRSFTKRPLLGPDAATSKQLDVFHQLSVDPLKEHQNTALLSDFVTDMGKIQGRNVTNLTWKNQRRIGKAIRRAKMMGLIPMHSKRRLLDEPIHK